MSDEPLPPRKKEGEEDAPPKPLETPPPSSPPASPVSAPNVGQPIVMGGGPSGPSGAPQSPAPDVPMQAGGGAKTAAQLFAEARQKADAFVASTGRPAVDKYFGSKLPPVCRQLGCYVTDDGKFFYCINPHCHKDKKRETKYNRRRKSVVYFYCPKCKSREIQLHLKANNYECLDCAYTWKH